VEYETDCCVIPPAITLHAFEIAHLVDQRSQGTRGDSITRVASITHYITIAMTTLVIAHWQDSVAISKTFDEPFWLH
jgi:hypothetical protein